MTLDTYPHVLQTKLREAADRMDDALGMDGDSGSKNGGDDGPAAAGMLVKG